MFKMQKGDIRNMIKDNFITVLMLLMLTAILCLQAFIFTEMKFLHSLNILSIAGYSSEIMESVRPLVDKKTAIKSGGKK